MKQNRTIEELTSFTQCVKERLESKAKEFGITNAIYGDGDDNTNWEFNFNLEELLNHKHNIPTNSIYQCLENLLYNTITRFYNYHVSKVMTEVRNSDEYKTLRNKPINPFLD